MKKCVACAEEILLEAKLCKYCETVQSDPRFSRPVVDRPAPAGKEVDSPRSSESKGTDLPQKVPSSTYGATKGPLNSDLAQEPYDAPPMGKNAKKKRAAQLLKPALLGVSALALFLIGSVAVGELTSQRSTSEAVAGQPSSPTEAGTQEASPETSPTPEPSAIETESQTPSPTRAAVEVEPSSTPKASEPAESIQSELQTALDGWISKATVPPTATFVEEVGIFQGCPEDMCGPVTNFSLKFEKFPGDFGNTACQVLLQVVDKGSGKLLNRHAEKWAYLGEVYIGIGSLSSNVYLDGVPSSGVATSNTLKVACDTIHGLTESTKKFNTQISVSG